MYYINGIFIVLLLLSGCASNPQSTSGGSENVVENNAARDTVKQEITLYGKAISYLNNQQYDLARPLLQTLTQKRPRLAGPWVNLALIDIHDKNYDEATKKLKQTITLDPAMAQAYNLLGFVEKQKGNINQAIAYYLQAAEKKPDYAIAHYNVALLYDIYLQDIPDAVKHYKRYLELNPGQDKKTADWVAELENSLKQGKL